MVDRGVFSQFRRQRDRTAYRRQLTIAIESTPAIRALPGLLHLPLPIVGADGSLTPLRTALAQEPYATLAGRPGSGRRLVMQQLALYMARSRDGDEGLPALLDLPSLDDGTSAPAQLLDEYLRQLPGDRQPPARLAFWRGESWLPATEGNRSRYVLLINGWELLTAARRDLWRTALLALPTRHAGVRAAVAVPHEEPAWPGFRALTIATPPRPLVARWLQGTCPAAVRVEVEEALAPGGRLQHCCERLFEVSLLALLAPSTGIPASRAALYERALAALSTDTRLGGHDPHAPLGHPQMGRYALARRLASEGRFALLAELPPPDRAETALLAAEIAGDAAPVLAALWRARHSGDDVTMAMGRCLRERATLSPVWPLRVACELALLAQARPGPLREEALALLRGCLPALDAALAQVARRQRPARRLLTRLLRALPAELALPRAEAIAYGAESAESQAWIAADLLVGFGEHELREPTTGDGPPTTSPPPVVGAGSLVPVRSQNPADFNHAVKVESSAPGAPPAAAGPLARWAYVQALGGRERRALIRPEAAHALGASAAGATRLVAAGLGLLGDELLAGPARLAGLELLASCDTPAALAAIRGACKDRSPAVRDAALQALARVDPEGAQASLHHTISSGEVHWETRLEAALRLGERPGEDIDRLVTEQSGNESLPLYARLRLVHLLGPRTTRETLLQLIAGEPYDAGVRVAAAGVLAASEDPARLAELPALLEDSHISAEIRRALCERLAASAAARTPALIRALLRAIRQAIDGVDLPLATAAVGALGRIGAREVFPTLRVLLEPDVLDRFLRALPARSAQAPAAECLENPQLPTALRALLATALARGLTPADRPTTLHEFMVAEVDRLRASTAQALGALGGQEAAAALRAALCQPACEATAAAAAALAAIAGPAALCELLGGPQAPQAVRWQIVQHLARAAEGEGVMRATLGDDQIDTFTRGALVEALGRRGASSSLLALSALARDPDGDPHVQAQAVAALGMLNEPAAEVVLLRIFADPAFGEELRGQAAAALPHALSDEGRQALRDTLRTERVPGPIVAGALNALGRARDREALALALRYCLDERPAVVRAAIGALADIGEETVTPVLARTAQSPGADQMVRVQAIGALLRLSGHEYRLMLQPYLAHRSPLIQLRALDELSAAGAPVSELAALLADTSRSLPLRLRALERIAAAPAALAMLTALLTSDDELQLRCRAAMALGAQGATEAAATIAAVAEAEETDDALRFRCIEALGRLGGGTAWQALSQMATAAQGSFTQLWARQALEQSAER
jgi:HEAT repeat protein